MYSGVKTVDFSDQEWADFLEGRLKVDALVNQYVEAKYKGELKKQYKYDGKSLSEVRKKNFESQILGKIKPRNSRQELCMDLLESNVPLLAIAGVAGGGKTLLSTAHALQELQKGNYNKIVIIRNDVTVAGVKELGALPGDATEKLRESVAYISDIITDFMFDSLLQQNKIEIVYLGTMRSRSLSESYILCNEAQNLSTDLVKMIITRVGERSRLVFDFDISQIDSKRFQTDNGMTAMCEALKGHPLFGAVELVDIERSEVAKLASLIN